MHLGVCESASHLLQQGCVHRERPSALRPAAVEGATPRYEIVKDKPDGEVKHDRTGPLTPPQFPYQVRKKAAAPGSGSKSNAKPEAKTDTAVVQVLSAAGRVHLVDDDIYAVEPTGGTGVTDATWLDLNVDAFAWETACP